MSRVPALLAAACLLAVTSACPPAQETQGAGATSSASARRAPDTLLPRPSGPLVLEVVSGKFITFQDVLAQLSRLTGVTYSAADQVTNQLARSTVSLSQSTSVPAEEVYPWAESLLAQQGFTLGILQTDPAPLVGVFGRGGMSQDPPATSIDIARVEECRNHPATMFTTVATLPHVDVRSLGNSLRVLSPDTNTGGVVPVGTTNSVILCGPGRNVADLAALMQKIESEAAAAAATAAAAQAAPKQQ